jgi:hypothetical protein
VLELTYNHGVDSYDLGTGYNHIAIAVDDLDGTLEGCSSDGIEPEKPPYVPAAAPRAPSSPSCATPTATDSRCELGRRAWAVDDRDAR